MLMIIWFCCKTIIDRPKWPRIEFYSPELGNFPSKLFLFLFESPA